ncbi:hypothetical protein DAI22_01g316000 [Oryza sativa Japonica Group]|nr:hypothetical protein DAI22_01g316000 [Oryza sativa Japonica Group]
MVGSWHKKRSSSRRARGDGRADGTIGFCYSGRLCSSVPPAETCHLFGITPYPRFSSSLHTLRQYRSSRGALCY